MSKRRRKLTAEDIPEVKDADRNVLETLIPETETVQKVDYGNEQDIRIAVNRNGRTPHLVGSTVDSGDPPSIKDDDDGHGDHHGDGRTPQGFRYFLAGVYLAAGAIAIYTGILMIRDLRTENKEAK